jgi:hypothetical protein
MPLYFGLDAQTKIDSIEIDWPSGKKQVIDGPVEANQVLTIEEKE